LRTVILSGSMMLAVGSMIGILVKGSARSSASVLSLDDNPRAHRLKAFQKRKSFRVKSDSPFELKDSTGQYLNGTAWLRDISVDGACFESSWMLKPGKTIEARLHSSREGLLYITGKVVWSQPKRDRIMYGLQFQSMTPAR